MKNAYKRKCILVFLVPVLLLVLPAVAMAGVHTVVKGDTIYGISARYNVSQFSLRYANNLWNDMIWPGQQLNVPVRYTVKRGDTLSAIGNNFHISYQKIKEINQLTGDGIYPGQVLYIPQNAAQNQGSSYKPAKTTNYSVSRGGISMSDFDLLARIITAEADSESYETQVAVGATVLNRVESPDFPDSIRGVVYQVDAGGKYQFEPVLNGWINNPASESGKMAARDALEGADPTNGALYFFESWVPNKFLQSRPVSTIMDAFTFSF